MKDKFGQTPPLRRVVHVDINSYFATLLQQENPFLRGRPIGVTKSAGRTCIIAASKEAKALGVKGGSYLPDALKLAPNLLTVPAEFDRYLDCTKRLREIFLSLAPDLHIFSLDEAFIELTYCSHLYPDEYIFAQLVQQKIKEELGEWVTCNVGLSHSRVLAKLASEISPPDSIFAITPENQDAVMAQAEFSDVCGIGSRLEAKLRMLGIHHPYEIHFWSEEELLPTFGPFWSKELKRIARGEDSHILDLLDDQVDNDMKSVGRTITGWKLADDETHIKQTLYNLSEELISKVRKMDMAGRHVGVGLWGDGKQWFAHKTLKYYVRHTREFFSLIYDQLYSQWQRDFKIIKFGVFLSGLQRQENLTLPLLPEWHKQERISVAMDKITQKYGLFTVKPATLMNWKMIRPEVTGYLGDKKYYGLG